MSYVPVRGARGQVTSILTQKRGSPSAFELYCGLAGAEVLAGVVVPSERFRTEISAPQKSTVWRYMSGCPL